MCCPKDLGFINFKTILAPQAQLCWYKVNPLEWGQCSLLVSLWCTKQLPIVAINFIVFYLLHQKAKLLFLYLFFLNNHKNTYTSDVISLEKLLHLSLLQFPRVVLVKTNFIQNDLLLILFKSHILNNNINHIPCHEYFFLVPFFHI